MTRRRPTRKRPRTRPAPAREPEVGTPAWFAPEAVRIREQRLATQVLHIYQVLFERTKNPVHVWFAIEAADRLTVPFPAWVRTYLSRIAPHIAERCRHQQPHGDALATAVYHALEFDRSHSKNPFTERSDHWHRLQIACEVRNYVLDGNKPDFAIDTVMREHPRSCAHVPRCRTPKPSRSTVSRAWREFRDSLISSPTK